VAPFHALRLADVRRREVLHVHVRRRGVRGLNPGQVAAGEPGALEAAPLRLHDLSRPHGPKAVPGNPVVRRPYLQRGAIGSFDCARGRSLPAE
jgi:hypothetical protein